MRTKFPWLKFVLGYLLYLFCHEADRILPGALGRILGEGFESVEDWRRAHGRFWAEHDIDDDTLIVAERFRLIERLQ